MPTLYVVNREGLQGQLEAEEGISVMEALRDAGFDEILSLCGGSCACATCHVYVEGGQVPLLPPMGNDENDLLESSSHRQDNSRLSCQLRLTPQLDGLRVVIAPAD